MTATNNTTAQSYTSYEYQNEGLTIGRNFNSLQAFIETARQGELWQDQSYVKDDPAWLGKAGLSSWQDVVCQLNTWQAYEMAKVEAIIGELSSRIQTPTKRRKRATWKEQADNFSFERALDRKERCWQGSRKINRNAPRSVDIVFEFGATASVNASDLLNKPAVAIALCDLLEEAGYIVRLIGHRRADGCWFDQAKKSANSVENIILKDEGQPLDKVSVVNSMTGWFYRTICFAARSNFPREHGIENYSRGMGSTRCVTNTDTEHVIDNLNNAIIIKGSYDLLQIVKETSERLVEMGIIGSEG
jgi:hypothetical protein